MKKSFAARVKRDFQRHKFKYLIFIPVLVYLILFCYKPMYGVIIAFQKFRPSLGIDGSPWVGLEQFARAFDDPYFWRALRNTFTISLLSLVFSFPVPVLLALLLNEVKVSWFKRTIQTLTYMPHFIATVVVCGMITVYCQTNGLFSQILVFFGGEPTNLLTHSKYFYPIYILSTIWQNVGWDSIIFLAALAGIDQEQYEAARIDGASRMQQMRYITFPGLVPTISMLLVLKLGKVLNVGYEKILLLYQPLTYDVADVISTYVYRKGLIDADYSFSTAVNLFNSAVNIVFLLVSNRISKKLGQSGLF
ncbi:MAG: sugar ABC transporter permease [Lachnospiraceae bacterium]|nr:sugar ABC transporter permease [Lachnospiraceae bacterium]MBR4059891.1 sugar ABC transporter permease [Lachnospiraceae bacterium]